MKFVIIIFLLACNILLAQNTNDTLEQKFKERMSAYKSDSFKADLLENYDWNVKTTIFSFKEVELIKFENDYIVLIYDGNEINISVGNLISLHPLTENKRTGNGRIGVIIGIIGGSLLGGILTHNQNSKLSEFQGVVLGATLGTITGWILGTELSGKSKYYNYNYEGFSLEQRKKLILHEVFPSNSFKRE
jgi:hypothetical protein